MRRINPHCKPLQIIFLDYEMPIMDGAAVVAELFKLYDIEEARPGSTFIRPKIVCMSAHTAEEIRQKALNVGMDDYLLKPAKKEDLEVILSRYYRNDL